MVIGFRLYVFLVHVLFCDHFHAVEGGFLVAVVVFFLFFICHFANRSKILRSATRPYSLSLKSFGSSYGNSYILCFLRIITIRFICGERKIW